MFLKRIARLNSHPVYSSYEKFTILFFAWALLKIIIFPMWHTILFALIFLGAVRKKENEFNDIAKLLEAPYLPCHKIFIIV